MKKIINRKLYDTDTAEHICGYSGYIVDDEDDSYFKEENLYRKKNGEFFILGRGGADTDYAYKGWGMYSYYSPDGMPRIVPIYESDAKDFVEVHGEVEDYERLFGEVEE